MTILARRFAIALTVLVTVLAGWFVPATSADARTPTVSSLSATTVPASGGTRITVTGKNLNKVKAVYVGTTKVKVTHVSKAKLRFTAPRHAAGTVKIKLLVGKTKHATSLRLVYTADTVATTEPSSFAAAVLDLTNKARSAARTCGGTDVLPAVPALTSNDLLAGTAQAHSADMAAKNYFSHTSQDGTSFSARITQSGYAWSSIGENIAAGYATPAAVVAGWLASPGHCKNIMSASFSELGVGYATGGSYGTYWTQDFGRPAS